MVIAGTKRQPILVTPGIPQHAQRGREFNKEFLQQRNTPSTTSQQGVPSSSPSQAASPSDVPRYTYEEYELADRTLKMLDEEECQAMRTDEKGRSSDLKIDDKDEEEEDQDVGQ